MTPTAANRARLAALAAAAVAVPVVASAAHGHQPGCDARVAIVNLDNHTQRQPLRHTWTARAAGQPELLHIARRQADTNRAASLKGIPTWGTLPASERRKLDADQPDAPHDRDEYPPAMSDEGGHGADVRYVLSSQNRSAGATMSSELADCPDGHPFRFERKPGPH